jgi:hypothetical protein|tara:strand:+ start:257 stop:493 length:237 start_codon:yes stop_codon:yes gene_type:complete
MGNISYLGNNRITSDQEIQGDLIVSGTVKVETSLFVAGAEPVTFGALQKMVVTETTTNLLNFDFISTSSGEVVIHEEL